MVVVRNLVAVLLSSTTFQRNLVVWSTGLRMEKRELFIWKEAHERLLISEILQEEPYTFKQGSKERGSCWTKIAERLTQAGLKVTQRSVREKFNKMMVDFKKKEKEELKASGIEVEYGEVDQGLQDISERMSEIEEERENETKKLKKERESAEEMRRKAAETLSQTKKRKSSGTAGDQGEGDSDPDEDADISPKKKKRVNASIAEIMKESLEAKKQEKAKEQEIREKELELKKAEQENQHSFHERMMHQQSVFMQQQQAMSMAMINAINEMMKKFNN